MKANVTFLLNQLAELGVTPREAPTAGMTTVPGLEGEAPEELTGDWILPSAPGEPYVVNTATSSFISKNPKVNLWMVDSGSSIHLVNDINLLQQPVLHDPPKPLHLATPDAVGGIVASGNMSLRDSLGYILYLRNVQCVPSATTNLISVSAAIRDGCHFVSDCNGAPIQLCGPGSWKSPVAVQRGLYYVQQIQDSRNMCSLSANQISQFQLPHNCKLRTLWHARLGHKDASAVMSRLSKEPLVTGLPVSLIPCSECPPVCEACIQGKQTRPPFGQSSRPAQTVLERIHVDTVGELPVTAVTGEKYWVTVVDEYTHYVAAIPVKTKAEIPRRLKDLLLFWENQSGYSIKCVRSDRGTEFLNQEFKTFCSAQGIKMETSAPGTPQQNGVAERMNRTLKEHVKSLLAHVTAKQSLWREALQAAVIHYNLGPVTGRSVTPYECFTGTKPSVAVLRSWGCKAFLLLQPGKTTATGPRSVPVMFVGYELGSKAYRVFNGTAIKVSRDITFLEDQNGAAVVGFSDPGAWGRSLQIRVPGEFSERPQQNGEKPQNAPGRTWGVPTVATPLVPAAEPLGQKSKLPTPSGLSRLQQLLTAGLEKRAQQGVLEAPSPTPSQTAINLETGTGAAQSRERRSWSVLDNMKTLARDGGALPQLDSRLKKAQLSLRRPTVSQELQPSQPTRLERLERRNAVRDQLLLNLFPAQLFSPWGKIQLLGTTVPSLVRVGEA